MENILSFNDWKLEKEKEKEKQRKRKSIIVVFDKLFNSNFKVIKNKSEETKLQKSVRWAIDKLFNEKTSNEKTSNEKKYNEKKYKVILIRVVWMVVGFSVYGICRQLAPLIELKIIQWFPNQTSYIYFCIENAKKIIETKKKKQLFHLKSKLKNF